MNDTARTQVRESVVRSGGVELCVAEFGERRTAPQQGAAPERTQLGHDGAPPDRGAAGQRPTVVLVHGYPDSKEVWTPVARRLAENDMHVVLYDVRGHGRSSAPVPLRGGFTLEKLTDDFLAVADAVSPDRQVHLVGHDWGSVQGWEFATIERTRGRLASFTSLSGPSLDHVGTWIRERTAHPTPGHLAQLLRQAVKSWYVGALHTPALPGAAWRGPLGRRFPALVARAEHLPADDDYPAPSLPEDAAHGAWLYRDNIRERLGRPRADACAHVPVQVIVPTLDPFLSISLYDDLDRWVPRLTCRAVRARHWLPRTRPDMVAAWITGFVADREKELRSERSEERGTASARAAASGDEAAASAVEAPASRPGSGRPGRARWRPYVFGQLVLVTGAAGGIGRATVRAAAEGGARVIAVDIDAEGAGRTAELARVAGAPEAWSERADVGDGDAMEALAAKVAAEHGVVDVLVNNAGIGMSGAFLDTTAEESKQVLDVNLWGVIHGCRLFGRQMADRGQGGAIVNVASAAAFQPSRALPAYSTSKAAVLMLTECLRAELTGRGIGVSAVCSGFVHTGITTTARFTGVSVQEQQRLREKTSRMYGMRGYPPEKVADAVLRAVARDEPVVPVTPEARALAGLARVAQGTRRAVARWEPPW